MSGIVIFEEYLHSCNSVLLHSALRFPPPALPKIEDTLATTSLHRRLTPITGALPFLSQRQVRSTRLPWSALSSDSCRGHNASSSCSRYSRERFGKLRTRATMSSPVQKPSRLRETVVAEHGGKSSQAHDAPKSPEVPKSPKQQEAHSKSDTTSTSTSSSSSSSSSSKSHGLANIDTSAASGKATSGDASTSVSPVTSPRALPHIVGKSVTLPRPSGGGGGSTSSFTSNHGKTATDASVPSTSISDSSSSLKRESLLTRISSGITGSLFVCVCVLPMDLLCNSCSRILSGIRNRVRSTSSLDGRKKGSRGCCCGDLHARVHRRLHGLYCTLTTNFTSTSNRLT